MQISEVKSNKDEQSSLPLISLSSSWVVLPRGSRRGGVARRLAGARSRFGMSQGNGVAEAIACAASLD